MNKKRSDKNRREFIKNSLSGVASAILLKGVSYGKMAIDIDSEPFPELIEATIADLQVRLRSGRLTARRLTEMYLERIRVIDQKTRSVIEINPDALAIADRLDAERKRGRVRSPLHGIPILIKDNLDTADRMMTTAGSLALVGAPTPKQDAFVVKKLRDAGAVILGKTNLSEWANFRGNRSISGWSARGGQTNNPYYLDQNPCGSSSGSGVAPSANLCAAAVGTETNGSIICPAVTNGVVGIKPTLGLVSRSGIIPIAHTQDTAGPMTRTVADAAVMLGAMVGRDNQDAITVAADKNAAKDYTKFLDPNGLKGARLGLVTQFLPQQNRDQHRAYYQPFIDRIRAAGATLIEVTFTPDYSKVSADRLSVLLYEFKADLNKYLAGRGSAYRTLEDLIKFNEDNKEKELKLFGQELFTQAQAKGDLTEKGYIEALANVKRTSRDEGIDAVMAKDQLDALVSPTTGATWAIAATAGYPYITVPLGLRELPASTNAAGNAVPPSVAATGMAFWGKAFSEPALIKYAYAFEQLTIGRVSPQFFPKYVKTA